MDKFKFTDSDRESFAIAIRIYCDSYDPPESEYDILDRIETIISSCADGDQKEDEFTVLMDKAVRMQELYRAQRYGLSDQEMKEIVEYLDDLRRIPKPPKTAQQ